MRGECKHSLEAPWRIRLHLMESTGIPCLRLQYCGTAVRLPALERRHCSARRRCTTARRATRRSRCARRWRRRRAPRRTSWWRTCRTAPTITSRPPSPASRRTHEGAHPWRFLNAPLTLLKALASAKAAAAANAAAPNFNVGAGGPSGGAVPACRPSHTSGWVGST